MRFFRRSPLVARAAAALLVLGFGAARLPLESRLAAAQHAAGFNVVQLDVSLLDQLGQRSFLAALSGFRALVADFVWIEAFSAWERVEYGRVNLLCNTVTTLEPRNVEFWDQSAWHMAWNGASHARDDARAQPREALRRKAEREYVLLGKSFAERGLANHPGSHVLHERLARLFIDKLHDPCAASAEYARAAACPDAMGYEHRFAAFLLAQCPGREREAYWLLRYYHDQSERERVPTLERLLRELEEKIQLPREQRVDKGG